MSRTIWSMSPPSRSSASMYSRAPGDASRLDAHHRDAAHQERRAVGEGARPAPFGDLGPVPGERGGEELGVEVGHATEHAGPVLAHLGAPGKGAARMRRLLAPVVGREARDEGVEVVLVHRVPQPVHHLAHDRPPVHLRSARRHRDPSRRQYRAAPACRYNGSPLCHHERGHGAHTPRGGAGRAWLEGARHVETSRCAAARGVDGCRRRADCARRRVIVRGHLGVARQGRPAHVTGAPHQHPRRAAPVLRPSRVRHRRAGARLCRALRARG